jgi:DNA-directed RNA polymerase specialized sigma24 family protein
MLLDDGLSKVDAAAVLGRSSGSLRKALSRNRAEAWARLRQKQRHRGV